jgi:hypothetical protein
MKSVKSVACVALLVSFVLIGLSTAAVAQNLTPEEEGLLYMWEEEKLARDVYSVMYEKWGKRIFGNIKLSEQTHMDAVKNLMKGYGLQVTVPEETGGVFTIDEIQGLYDDLVKEGLHSVKAALDVGVIIENTDIADLKDYMEGTEKLDIIRVYSNLLQGSLTHLEAFENQLN